MATLEKKHAVKIFTDILVDVYNQKIEFPERFDKFAYEIVTRLYKKFKWIEGNPVIFEKVMGLEQLPIQMNNSFELVDKE